MKCTGFFSQCDSEDATRRRQNTAYVNDESNWVELCDECFKECEEYWAGMWADYYRDCL